MSGRVWDNRGIWDDISYARRGDVELAYQRRGPTEGIPLLLVAGLGAQMLIWHDDFCGLLADRGFSVARFDNRDVGLSTHLSAGSRPPGRVRTVLRPSSAAAYGLEEMAADTVAVLDALGWETACVVGASLGGAVVQTVALTFPVRVAGLVSIMSTPSLRIGRGRLGALAKLVRGPVATSAQAEQRIVELYRTIGSPGYELDEPWLREVAAREFSRAYDPVGLRRQLAAILVSGDRRVALGRVTAPTLVLHGVADPVFRLAAGRATADAVPGARLVSYPGMGHDLPRELWPSIVDEISSTAGLSR